MDRVNYVFQCSLVNNLIVSLNTSYYTSVIQEHSKDQKVLFKTVNKLLQKKKSQCYPPAPNPAIIADKFADFFSEKILKIHRNLSDMRDQSSHLTSYMDEECATELSGFKEVNEEFVKVLARKPM